MTRQELQAIVADAVRTCLHRQPGRAGADVAVDPETRLLGAGARLDSLSLVAAIALIEQRVEDDTGITITIASERAMSLEHSPFRTVGTLADYVWELTTENGGA